jgi:hypothetical protein
MVLAAPRLAALAASWEAARARRVHAAAELALIEPGGRLRGALLAATRAHPRWAEAYECGLRRLPALREHERCAKGVGPALESLGALRPEIQARVRLALAVDCEMVETAADSMALARISACDVTGEVVLDELVMPCEDPSFIEDTRQAITGIEKADLVARGIPLEAARTKLAMLCSEDTVLIGHSLDSDLKALRFKHDLVIDTAHLFRVLEARAAPSSELGGDPFAPAPLGGLRLHSLEYLSSRVLATGTDRDARGGVHDSVEDARKSLDLVKYALAAGLPRAAHAEAGAAAAAAATAYSSASAAAERARVQADADACAAAVAGDEREGELRWRPPPPLPPRERRIRARGAAYGFSGELQGRQQFANKALAAGSWAHDEQESDKARAYFSFHLPSSGEMYGWTPTPASKPTALAPTPNPVSRPATIPAASAAQERQSLLNDLRSAQRAGMQRIEANRRFDTLLGKAGGASARASSEAKRPRLFR